MSKPFLLTKQEREKFAAYCEQESLSAKQMGEQMQKLNMAAGLNEQIIKKFKNEELAYGFVAMHLRSIEEDSIG